MHFSNSQPERWSRFVRDGNIDATSNQSKRKDHTDTFCLSSSVHDPERVFLPAGEESRHDFQVSNVPLTHAFYKVFRLSQVTLERSSYTDEKYALYVTYQTQVHHDDDNTQRSFTRFLIQSPLVVRIPLSQSFWALLNDHSQNPFLIKRPRPVTYRRTLDHITKCIDWTANLLR